MTDERERLAAALHDAECVVRRHGRPWSEHPEPDGADCARADALLARGVRMTAAPGSVWARSRRLLDHADTERLAERAAAGFELSGSLEHIRERYFGAPPSDIDEPGARDADYTDAVDAIADLAAELEHTRGQLLECRDREDGGPERAGPPAPATDERSPFPSCPACTPRRESEMTSSA